MSEQPQSSTSEVEKPWSGKIDQALSISQKTRQKSLFVLGACLLADDPYEWLKKGINREYLVRALAQTPESDMDELIHSLILNVFPSLQKVRTSKVKNHFLIEFERLCLLHEDSITAEEMDEFATLSFTETAQLVGVIQWNIDFYTKVSEEESVPINARKKLLEAAQLEFNNPNLKGEELFLSQSIRRRASFIAGMLSTILSYNIAAQVQGPHAWVKFIESEEVQALSNAGKALLRDIPRASLPVGSEELTSSMWVCVEAMAVIMIHLCQTPLPLKKLESKLNLSVPN